MVAKYLKITQKCTVEKAAAAMLDAVRCALDQSGN